MSFDPHRTAALVKHRATLSTEQRQLEALEAIADNLHGLHTEMQSLRMLLESMQKGRGGF
ncbi:hypothetical protein HY26_07160 [Hyphomonas sp. GM-8P]|nr:hypothetical protein HY26_07160 [Hyphomonas sp. GM-8P]